MKKQSSPPTVITSLATFPDGAVQVFTVTREVSPREVFDAFKGVMENVFARQEAITKPEVTVRLSVSLDYQTISAAYHDPTKTRRIHDEPLPALLQSTLHEGAILISPYDSSASTAPYSVERIGKIHPRYLRRQEPDDDDFDLEDIDEQSPVSAYEDVCSFSQPELLRDVPDEEVAVLAEDQGEFRITPEEPTIFVPRWCERFLPDEPLYRGGRKTFLGGTLSGYAVVIDPALIERINYIYTAVQEVSQVQTVQIDVR